MVEWDYENPRFCEVKYEDMIKNEDEMFFKIFEHYGFRTDAIETCLKIVRQYSFENVAKRPIGQIKSKSHLRSGKPGEWKTYFTEQNKVYFKELAGDSLIKLGYEMNNDW